MFSGGITGCKPGDENVKHVRSITHFASRRPQILQNIGSIPKSTTVFYFFSQVPLTFPNISQKILKTSYSEKLARVF